MANSMRMRYADFTSFAVALMREMQQCLGIVWDPLLFTLPSVELQTCLTYYLISERRKLKGALDIVGGVDISMYCDEIPSAFVDIRCSEQLFQQHFLGPVFRRFMEPYSDVGFLRYIAYLYYFAIFCQHVNFPVALDYAVMTLVRAIHMRFDVLGHEEAWDDLFSTSSSLARHFLVAPNGNVHPVHVT